MTPYPWLLLLVYVVTVGGVQLLALWAAASRLPWLLRAVAVWVPIALLATVRAYEPAIVLLVSAALTIGLSRFSSPREPAGSPPAPWWRFRLADLLVLILFLGTWLGLTAPRVLLQYQHWPLLNVALIAMPLVVLTVCTHRTVLGPRRVTMGIATLVAIWFCALLMRAGNAPLYLDRGPTSLAGRPVPAYFWVAVQGAMPVILAGCLALPLVARRLAQKLPDANRRRVVLVAITVAVVLGLPTSILAWDEFRRVAWGDILLRLAEIGIHSIPFVALSGLLALVTWLGAVGWGQAPGWKSRLARGTVYLLVLAATVPGAWIYWHMVRYTPFPKFEPRPVNHYHEIVAIARRVGVYSELDKAVELLRESNYAPRYFPEPEFWGAEPGDWPTGSEVRSLADRLALVAADAVRAGQYDRAADYAMAIIRFDAMVDHGGSSAYAGEGFRLLAVNRGNVTPDKARELIQLLERTLHERYPAETIAAWDLAQLEKSQGWRQRLRSILEGRVPIDRSEFLARTLDARKPAETSNRLLQADLAIRLFRGDRGRLPTSLAELTPKYLSESPIDPYSGRPLVYRPHTDWFELYSVGPDGHDDRGRTRGEPRRPGNARFDIPLDYPKF